MDGPAGCLRVRLCDTARIGHDHEPVQGRRADVGRSPRRRRGLPRLRTVDPADLDDVESQEPGQSQPAVAMPHDSGR